MCMLGEPLCIVYVVVPALQRQGMCILFKGMHALKLFFYYIYFIFINLLFIKKVYKIYTFLQPVGFKVCISYT